MLPQAGEMPRAMAGCVAVLRRDPDAMDHFGDDAGAFLRSFFASVLVLPLLILKALVAGAPEEVTVAPQLSFIGFMLLYLVSWLLWPVVADVVARALGKSNSQYFRYIAAYNWSQLPIAVVLLIATMIAPPFALVALGLSLLYLAFLAAIAWELPMGGAVGLVILDFGLGFALQATVLALAGGFAPA